MNRRQHLQHLAGLLAVGGVSAHGPWVNNDTRVYGAAKMSRVLPFHWVDVFAAGPLAARFFIRAEVLPETVRISGRGVPVASGELRL
jgi:hypothetical protein